MTYENDKYKIQQMIDPPYDEIEIHLGLRLLEYCNIHPLTDSLIDQHNSGLTSIYELVDGLEAIEGVNIDWWKISYQSAITEEFALKYADKLYWLHMFSNSNTIFSQEFIENNKYRIDWHYSNIYFMTETLIERIDIEEIEKSVPNLWFHISQRDDLSLNFIEKYQNKLNWKFLARGKLSDKFIGKFTGQLKEFLDPDIILQAKKRYRAAKLNEINRKSGT